MKIEAIKERARSHEQNEEWQKALDLYLDAIRKLADDEDGQPDISLYNRAGDLQTRIGNVEAAIGHYEEAIDLYLEADLANNAIAICKKVLRNLPDRADIYLKLGQIRARQGFLVDARQNFLTYAELKQQAGEMDEAFRALVEFADLAPDDVDIRLAVAQQMETSDRPEDAVGQYVKAYRQYVRKEEHDQAEEIRAKIEELDPEAEIPDPEEIMAGEAEIETSFSDELPGFETTAFTTEEEQEEPEGDLHFGREEDEEEPVEPALEPDVVFGDEEEEEEPEPLPMMEFDEEEEEEREEPLPELEFADEVEEEEKVFSAKSFEGPEELDEEEEPEPLPTVEYHETEEEEAASAREAEDLEEEGLVEVAASDETTESLEEAEEEEALARRLREEEEAAAAGDHRELADAGDFQGAMRVIRERIMESPDDVELHQRLVEYAHRAGDKTLLVPAYLDLADCLERQGAESKARAVYQQVVTIDPENPRATARLEGREVSEEADRDVSVASSDDYVDLGSMVIEEEGEKTTRWVVSAEEPTGDEEADFAAMLSQFKQKVAENVAQDDIHAHYDLGTAYKEMGLIDEAIGEFQQALRADAGHLPTYEMLGQCFLEQGEYEVAARSLTKAVNSPDTIEDDLIGIYYYLGRAHEGAGNTDSAREFYEKVFALDINFADVTERLRALR